MRAALEDLPGQCACFAFSRRHHWLTGRPGTSTTLYKDQAVKEGECGCNNQSEVFEGRNLYIYNGQRGKFNYNDHESRKSHDRNTREWEETA